MTENLKESLSNLLKFYKEDRISEDRLITIIESVIGTMGENDASEGTWEQYTPNTTTTLTGEPYCTSTITQGIFGQIEIVSYGKK